MISSVLFGFLFLAPPLRPVIGAFADWGNYSCPRGYILSNATNSTANHGDDGHIMQTSGDEWCLQCQWPYTSDGGRSTVCDLCSPKFYRATKTGAAYTSHKGLEDHEEEEEEANRKTMLRCLPCPRGANCQGYSLTPVPKKGFWVNRDSLETVHLIHKCLWETCVGASVDITRGGFDRAEDAIFADWRSKFTPDLVGQENCWYPDNISLGECDANGLMCSTGARGPLCQSCEPTHFFSQASKDCVECFTPGFRTHLAPVITILAVCGGVIVALLLHSLSPCFDHAYRQLANFGPVAAVRFMDTGVVKVLVSTYQILTALTWTLSYPYPAPFSSFIRVLSFLVLDVSPWTCFHNLSSGSPFFLATLTASLLPICLCVLLWIVFILHVIVDEVLLGLPRFYSLYRGYNYLNLAILWFVYPVISMIQFQALDCFALPDEGGSFLRLDTHVDCDSQDYRNFRGVNILMIVIYQLIPAYFYYVLLGARAAWVEEQEQDGGMFTTRLDSNRPELAHVYFLVNNLKYQHFFFDVYDSYRRLLFVALVTLIPNSVLKLLLTILLAVCTATCLREIDPYTKRTIYELFITGQYTLVIICGLTLLLVTKTDVFGSSTDLGVSVALLCFSLVCLVTALRDGWRRYKQSVKRRLTVDMQSTIVHIEYACHFSDLKFFTTFAAVEESYVPHSHVLVYYYTSMAHAKFMLRSDHTKHSLSQYQNEFNSFASQQTEGDISSVVGGGNGSTIAIRPGLPALKRYEGVVFSLLGPHELFGEDRLECEQVFGSMEAVMCCSLPQRLLWPLTEESESSSSLRVIPTALLLAMWAHTPHTLPQPPAAPKERGLMKEKSRGVLHRGETFLKTAKSFGPMSGRESFSSKGSAAQNYPWVTLPIKCVLRVYQLLDNVNLEPSAISPAMKRLAAESFWNLERGSSEEEEEDVVTFDDTFEDHLVTLHSPLVKEELERDSEALSSCTLSRSINMKKPAHDMSSSSSSSSEGGGEHEDDIFSYGVDEVKSEVVPKSTVQPPSPRSQRDGKPALSVQDSSSFQTLESLQQSPPHASAEEEDARSVHNPIVMLQQQAHSEKWEHLDDDEDDVTAHQHGAIVVDEEDDEASIASFHANRSQSYPLQPPAMSQSHHSSVGDYLSTFISRGGSTISREVKRLSDQSTFHSPRSSVVSATLQQETIQTYAPDVELEGLAFKHQGEPVLLEPKNAEDLMKRLEQVRLAVAHDSSMVLVYHFTSPEAAECIVKEGLAMSTQGQGDGGVYFSTKGPASLKIGEKNYERNIIMSCFGKERMSEYLGQGKLDVCIVYAIDPRLLQQAPVRDHARMIGRRTFESLSLPATNGKYYLRPDRIVSAFVLKPDVSIDGIEDSSIRARMDQERVHDVSAEVKIQSIQNDMKANAAAIREFVTEKKMKPTLSSKRPGSFGLLERLGFSRDQAASASSDARVFSTPRGGIKSPASARPRFMTMSELDKQSPPTSTRHLFSSFHFFDPDQDSSTHEMEPSTRPRANTHDGGGVKPKASRRKSNRLSSILDYLTPTHSPQRHFDHSMSMPDLDMGPPAPQLHTQQLSYDGGDERRSEEDGSPSRHQRRGGVTFQHQASHSSSGNSIPGHGIDTVEEGGSSCSDVEEDELGPDPEAGNIAVNSWMKHFSFNHRMTPPLSTNQKKGEANERSASHSPIPSKKVITDPVLLREVQKGERPAEEEKKAPFEGLVRSSCSYVK